VALEDRIDPITLEVIYNRLNAIADEMENVVLRSSYSVIIKEVGDASSAIFTIDGEAIAHAIALPLHLGVMGAVVRSLLDAFPPEAMEDDDVYVMNDPYLGGTHLPDLVIAMPVIHDGRPVALTAVLAHHGDMGGLVPGSMPATATEIFQEGLIIPPLKLRSAGVENETLLRMIERNVRLPTEVLGDIHGQIGAATAGRDRLLHLFDEYGQDVVLEHMRELLDRAEMMTRNEIAKIPDGTHSFEDYLDHDGVDIGKRLLPVRATVTIVGDRIHVDMTGTNPQTRGSANGPPSTAFAPVVYALRTIVDPATPINGGSERPIELVVPEGTMVNPRRPAAVALRSQLASRVLKAVYGALVRFVPDRIAADSGEHDGVLGLAGVDPETDNPWGFAFEPVGGMGARPTKDGVDGISTHLANVLSVPAEVWESGGHPLRMVRHAVRIDSGGAGRWRGGLGLEWQFEVLRGEVTASWRGDRHFSAPWGLFGGGAGASWRLLVHRNSGEVEEIPGRSVFTIHVGERVELLGGGGGGYGDPLEREPERVRDDVLDGKVSREAAQREYGVVVRSETAKLELRATSTLRDRLRAERGPISWTFDRGPLGRE
jgi:N-methylhydantoinase B